jgi:hypothetical protein
VPSSAGSVQILTDAQPPNLNQSGGQGFEGMTDPHSYVSVRPNANCAVEGDTGTEHHDQLVIPGTADDPNGGAYVIDGCTGEQTSLLSNQLALRIDRVLATKLEKEGPIYVGASQYADLAPQLYAFCWSPHHYAPRKWDVTILLDNKGNYLMNAESTSLDPELATFIQDNGAEIDIGAPESVGTKDFWSGIAPAGWEFKFFINLALKDTTASHYKLYGYNGGLGIRKDHRTSYELNCHTATPPDGLTKGK